MLKAVTKERKPSNWFSQAFQANTLVLQNHISSQNMDLEVFLNSFLYNFLGISLSLAIGPPFMFTMQSTYFFHKCPNHLSRDSTTFSTIRSYRLTTSF